MNAATANLAGITGITRRLVLDGALNEADARHALDEATKAKKHAHVYLLEQRLVTGGRSPRPTPSSSACRCSTPARWTCASRPIKLVSEELIQKHQALPLFKRGNRLFVGISDPTNTRALDEIKFHTNLTVEPILVDEDRLQRDDRPGAASQRQPGPATMGDAEGLENLEVSGGDDDDSQRQPASTPRATTRRSSSSSTRCCSTRSSAAPPTSISNPTKPTTACACAWTASSSTSPRRRSSCTPRIAARLKVMAQLDIAERRVPQDGRIKLNLSKTKQIDFRVSTCPTLFGEKIVLRILDGRAAKLGIDKLGYEDDQKKLFLDAIAEALRHGAGDRPDRLGQDRVAVHRAEHPQRPTSRNISTVEDPVEIRVPGINQVQMNLKRGMTFAAALRAFLRQDPDVIMVGEIRDLETAEIAIKAAQTGHMVLSTLHTNDAPQTISRLMNMGIAPYNITSSVTLVIAQRLARRLHDCKRASAAARSRPCWPKASPQPKSMPASRFTKPSAARTATTATRAAWASTR